MVIKRTGHAIAIRKQRKCYVFQKVVEKRYATHIVCMECKKKEKVKEVLDGEKNTK